MRGSAAGKPEPPEEPPPRSPGAPASAWALPEGLRSLRHRDYRLFFFSQLISLTGSWMQTLAQGWLILSLTNSPAALGLVSVFQFGPSLLLGLPAGVVVDRVPKRLMLLLTQGSAATVTALLAFQIERGEIQVWQIYLAAMLMGIIVAFDTPARQAFVIDLVGREDLMNGIALNSTVFNTTRVIGPALAGLLLSAFGPGICFVANALSYIPVLGALAVMHTRGAPRPDANTGSPLERLREGLAYSRKTPAVLLPIILAGLMAIFGMNFGVWAPLLARDALDIGAGGFGLLLSALGIGSLTGALTLAFTSRRPAPHLLLVTALAFGLLEIALALAAALGAPPLLAMLLMVGIGFTMSTTMTRANTTVQTNTPDHMRGRVMAIYFTVFTGAAPFGGALAGAISDLWGVAVAIAIGGAVVSLAVLALRQRMPQAEEMPLIPAD